MPVFMKLCRICVAIWPYLSEVPARAAAPQTCARGAVLMGDLWSFGCSLPSRGGGQSNIGNAARNTWRGLVTYFSLGAGGGEGSLRTVTTALRVILSDLQCTWMVYGNSKPMSSPAEIHLESPRYSAPESSLASSDACVAAALAKKDALAVTIAALSALAAAPTAAAEAAGVSGRGRALLLGTSSRASSTVQGSSSSRWRSASSTCSRNSSSRR